MRIKALREPPKVRFRLLRVLVGMLQQVEHIRITAHAAYILRRAAAFAADHIEIGVLPRLPLGLLQQRHLVLPVIAQVVAELERISRLTVSPRSATS